MHSLIQAFTKSKQRYVLAKAQISEKIQATGMTPEQYAAVFSIPEKGISAKALAKKTGILGPSLSRMINDLEAFGVITRTDDEKDLRACVLNVTEHGKRLLARISN